MAQCSKIPAARVGKHGQAKGRRFCEAGALKSNSPGPLQRWSVLVFLAVSAVVHPGVASATTLHSRHVAKAAASDDAPCAGCSQQNATVALSSQSTDQQQRQVRQGALQTDVPPAATQLRLGYDHFVKAPEGSPGALATAVAGSHVAHSDLSDDIEDTEAARTKRFNARLRYVGVTGSLVALIFAICSDDLPWMVPCVLGQDKWTFGVIYLVVMPALVAMAWGVMLAGIWLSHYKPNWPVDTVLRGISAAALAFFTVVLFIEWWHHRQGGEAENVGFFSSVSPRSTSSAQGTGSAAVAKAGCESGSSAKDPEDLAQSSGELYTGSAVVSAGKPGEVAAVSAPVEAAEDATTEAQDSSAGCGAAGRQEATRLLKDGKVEILSGDMLHNAGYYLTVSTVGNIDKVAIWVPMLLNRSVGPGQLFFSVFLASSCVLIIAIWLGQCRLIASIAKRIPLWFIMACLAVWAWSCLIMELTGQASPENPPDAAQVIGFLSLQGR